MREIRAAEFLACGSLSTRWLKGLLAGRIEQPARRGAAPELVAPAAADAGIAKAGAARPAATASPRAVTPPPAWPGDTTGTGPPEPRRCSRRRPAAAAPVRLGTAR